MINKNEYVYKIKESILNSPIRKIIMEDKQIPLKKMVDNTTKDIINQIKIIESNKDKPINIVVVGEVKSGKSSFINALLGVEVSEVDVLECTSNIIEISYKENAKKKEVDGIVKIGLNIDILKDINIVDTPGLKSITLQNENKTLNYIQNADLILFVIDATHLGQEDVVDALDVICEYEKKVVGIVNKSDLLDDANKDDTLEYIKQEYGIYIDDFFMISSYLEYQQKIGNKAIAKSTDLVISNYNTLGYNFAKLKEYIYDVKNKSNEIKNESIHSSIQGIIHKDIIIHYDYLKSLNMFIEEFKKYEKLLQNKLEYMNSKMEFEISDWVNTTLFNDEKDKIANNIENAKNYVNENYINSLINMKKTQLDELFFKEWSICLKEVGNQLDEDIKRYVDDITYKNEFLNNPEFKIKNSEYNINDILLVMGTGAILGTTSGAILSLYSALLGTSATSITLASAMFTYCPPLLIAGTATSAIGKALYDKIKQQQVKNDILSDIDKFVQELKQQLTNDLIKVYEESSREIVVTTIEILKSIKEIYISRYEIENLAQDIDIYIKQMQEILQEEMVVR